MSPSSVSVPIQNLESLLAQTLGNSFQIKHVEWKPLTAPGENYGSVMLAVNVTINRNNGTEILNLVAKLPPDTAYLLDLFNSPVTFKKELLFYSDVSQALINLQRESGIKEEDLTLIAPKYVGGRLGVRNPKEFDEQATIVLENLKYSDYTTQDRIHGLDRKHTEFAVKKLAKLHALIIALKLKKPQFFKDVVLGILKQGVNETAEKCVLGMIRKAQNDLKNMQEAEPYMERINKTIEYSIQKNKNPKEPEEAWSTLVHNDFWVNNMMFQYNKLGGLIGMKMVDFQLCVYDYGLYDLLFFLISSANKEILDNNLDDMINLYHDSFVKYLKTLGIDTSAYSKEKFFEILNYCAPIKFNQCIMMVHVIQAPREDPEKAKRIDAEDIFLNRSGDDICKQKLLHIVSIYDKKGWLIS